MAEEPAAWAEVLERSPDGQVIDPDEYSYSESESESADQGKTLGADLLMRYLPPGPGGVQFHIQIKEDGSGPIKPRRPMPLPIYHSDFYPNIVALPDGRYAYSGPGMNGWSALTTMEVRSITAKPIAGKKSPRGTSSRSPRLFRKNQITRVWDAVDKRSSNEAPRSPLEALEAFGGGDAYEYRATLRCAPWTLTGWSKKSPGMVWWYELSSRPAEAQTGRVLAGSMMVSMLDKTEAEPLCTHAYLMHHRYALPGGRKETTKDRLTWHSIVVLQWKHSDGRETLSVIELATLNGCAGRGGKSNWHADRNEPKPALYQAMPNRMKAPWDGTRAEIRCNDIEPRTITEFKQYVARYTGPLERFLDPTFTHDHRVRLSFRNKSHIMQYLLNYMGRDYRYSQLNRNCQTFATDFYAFICGKKGMTPFAPLQGVDYTQRTHLFLYDASMYDNPI